MNILIIGSGGREHAMVNAIGKTSRVQQIFVAPGNVGTALHEKAANVAIAVTDFEKLIAFAKQENVTLTIVGPEVPLSLGIVDAFEKEGLLCFGPSQKAAQLESSKAYAKTFMKKYGIKTADYATFNEEVAAKDYLHNCHFPIVIKADGLAAGKGVIICENLEKAQETVSHLLSQKPFGDASNEIIIESFLSGIESSFIVITDGETTLPLATSMDYKKLNDHDEGPNTGGMGAISPSPYLSETQIAYVMQHIVEPTLEGLKSEGIFYKGFLYVGLMISENGDMNVLEYNCRLGDPETQVILPRMQSDFTELCYKASRQQLKNFSLRWDHRHAITVVSASPGYPERPKLGYPIEGLTTDLPQDCMIFHAGTELKSGKIITAGGRVFALTALGETTEKAQTLAYNALEKISFEGQYFRRDIGQ